MIWVIDGQGGWATSQGMRKLAFDLGSFGYTVVSGLNPQYEDRFAIKQIEDYANNEHGRKKVVLVSYSLGCNAAARYADLLPHVQFDLIVGYDPTVNYFLKPLGSNVKTAICYHNRSRLGTSAIFGGAAFELVKGNAVTQLHTYDVYMDHTMVQNSSALHDITKNAIAAVYV